MTNPLHKLSQLFTTPKIAQLSASTDSGSGGGYDAERNNGARSTLTFPMTARKEITQRTRKAILEKKRAVEANLPLFPRMNGQVRKYAVGRGIFPQPRTSSKAWNKEAKRKFDHWANNRFVCDAAGAMTWWEMQGFVAETFFSEGEAFAAMISSSVTGSPQLQLIDSSEVGSGYSQRPGFVDGVRANAQNRPIEYEVTIASSDPWRPETQVISATDLIHVIKRKRVNQLRALCPGASGLNGGNDILDLDGIVMASTKLHNAMGVTVKKKSGDAGKNGKNSLSGKIDRTVNGEGQTTQIDEKFIRGAAIQYLGLDEELDIVTSDRPTQNLLDYIVYRIRGICLSTGLPYEIVWDMASLGGATARIALADAQFFFDHIQDLLNEMFNQRVWVWWCASMMNSGQLSVCPDPEWWVCDWQGPPKLTADAGRTAAQEIDLLRSGLNTYDDFYNARGRDWESVIDQRIEELRSTKEKCEAAGVDPALLFAPPPGTVMQINAPEKSE